MPSLSRSSFCALLQLLGWYAVTGGGACTRTRRPEPASQPAVAAAPFSAKVWCPQNGAEVVEVLGPGHCAMPRHVFFPSNACPTGTPRVAPVAADGGRGFKLLGVGPESVYRKCGFLDGDEWLRVNDVVLSSPDAVLDAYAALRNASTLDISLSRDGHARTIRIELR
jgi:hypothetical protein